MWVYIKINKGSCCIVSCVHIYWGTHCIVVVILMCHMTHIHVFVEIIPNQLLWPKHEEVFLSVVEVPRSSRVVQAC